VPTKSEVDLETEQLLEALESVETDFERERVIKQLSKEVDTHACRILIQAFHRSMWRSTKVAIVRGLGSVDQQRSTEFLLKQACHPRDLALAAEAILALGRTNSPVAGEFLLTVVDQPLHPLRREAVLALSNMRHFPCESTLATVFQQNPRELSPGFLQYVILGAGRRGLVSLWPQIRSLLSSSSGDGGPVFNAALLAAGQIGGADALQFLKELELPYRFFADELRLSTMERIARRLSMKAEDAVLEVLGAEDDEARWQALAHLRGFDAGSAWKAFEALGEEAHPTLHALVRVTLFDPDRHEADLAFLTACAADVDVNAAAALMGLHIGAGRPDFCGRLYPKVPRPVALRWMERVRDAGAIDRLTEWIDQGALAERTSAVDALVAQAHMAGVSSRIAQDCARRLFEKLEELPEGPLLNRVVRGIGQIGYADKEILTALEKMLKRRTPGASSSLYSALADLGTPEATGVILRRLRRKDTIGEELDDALAALARMGEVADVEALKLEGIDRAPRLRRSMMRILTANAVPGYADLVLEELKRPGLYANMVALAAAKWNHDDRIWDEVFRFLDSTNVCLRGRALDTLCVGGGEPQHLKLLRILLPSPAHRDMAVKLFQILVPKPGALYAQAIDLLDRWISKREGVFADQPLCDLAVQLRDRLAVLPRQGPGSTSAAEDANIRALDAELARTVPGFVRHSEPMRTALRSAELTYRHPEIFGERVDKSAAVVQYVKAIDLLLQEHVGGQLFSDRSGQLMVQLQARIVQLQLQEDPLPLLRVLADLQCESSFGPDTFPIAKLATISKNILSGKIYFDQLKTFDGLRAWSVALLLFGRPFRFRSIPIDPLIRMKVEDNEQVCELAAQLNILQNERNDAAHRGTWVRVAQLEQVRERSLAVLDRVGQMFS
jgi:hypothetical protein